MGKIVRVEPGGRNCLPEGYAVGFVLRPTDCTKKRGHLQVVAPEIDYVLRTINRAALDSEPEYDTRGNNFVETPCTCHASLAHALENRQCLADPTRPRKLAERHLKGYVKIAKQLTKELWAIIDTQGKTPKSLLEKAASYAGTKRVHYEKCAREAQAHPLSWAERDRIFHDGQVKWGELSSRPRALLVQSVRAKGTTGVKEGEILRLPILEESVFRELEEDALHKYMHARGYHMTASGMSMQKRGRIIDKQAEKGWWVVGVDLKNFDGTEGQTAVVERKEFLTAVEKRFGKQDALRAVLHTQNFNRVQAGPLSGKIYGNRGSGTAGTSTGNKKVMLSLLLYAMGPAAKGRQGCTFLCDGDDTLIFVPPKYHELLADGRSRWITSWTRRMAELGYEVKLEQMVKDGPAVDAVHETTFCRARVINTPRGFTLCKKPADAMKVATNFRRHFRGTRFKDYCQTLSESFRGSYGDVPILCELHELFNVGGKVDKQLLENSGMEYMMQRTKTSPTKPIELSHRLSFHKAFGVTPTMQEKCEQALRELQPRFRAAILQSNY